MKLFCDSSAFAKRFVNESGSEAIEALLAQASELGLSSICVPEIISALNRRLRERSLTSAQYQQAKRHLLDDVRDADIVELTHAVVMSGVSILEQSPVRAMDALHVACALEWGADLFASADTRQIAVARRAGLSTRTL